MNQDALRAIRRARLRWLRTESKYKDFQQQELAAKIGTSPAQLGQWLSGERNIGEMSARKIETALKYARGWLDGEMPGNDPEPSPMARQLVRALDAIDDGGRQGEAFVSAMEAIERCATSPAPVAEGFDPVATRRRTPAR